MRDLTSPEKRTFTGSSQGESSSPAEPTVARRDIDCGAASRAKKQRGRSIRHPASGIRRIVAMRPGTSDRVSVPVERFCGAASTRLVTQPFAMTACCARTNTTLTPATTGPLDAVARFGRKAATSKLVRPASPQKSCQQSHRHRRLIPVIASTGGASISGASQTKCSRTNVRTRRRRDARLRGPR